MNDERVDKVRIGLVGTGFAADLHAANYRLFRGHRVELTAVCSRSQESADRFAVRFGIPRVFTHYRSLAEFSEVDCVDVCVPTGLHHEMAIAAAAAGKHLIVEKPLTGYFGEGDEPRERMLEGALKNADSVLDAVKGAGVTLCYAEDFIYAPAVGKLKRLMAARAGAPSSSFVQRRAIPAPTRPTQAAGRPLVVAHCSGWAPIQLG